MIMLADNNVEQEAETLIMAHRYLYYVLCEPVLPDAQYDVIERQARDILPAESPVQRVGSSLPGSYTDAQVELAMKLRR